VNLRQRLRRVQLARQVLAAKGLRIADWEGRRYVVSDRKGRSQIVRDLGDLWPAAEELAGDRLDPLDEQLLAHLAARPR
jgi:hypothetical protein